MQAIVKSPLFNVRSTILLTARIIVKVLVLIVAVLLQASYGQMLIILFLIFFTELYKNLAAILIQKGRNSSIVGAFVSAFDGAVFIFALYFANALGTDVYLFVILSIALNTAEYGLLSAMVEGIVAGFSYAIFVYFSYGITSTAFFYTTYLLRICSLVFFGWITGWLANDLYDKENKLKLVLENDIHVEELNEVKTTFVSDAAESLKTPLSAIRGYIDIMMNGRVGQLDDKVKEYLSNISKNVIKVDSLVGELLHIIEIEDDSIRLRRKSVDVNFFVESLKEDTSAFSRIYGSRVEFTENLEQSYISIDEFRLKIAIKNILFYLLDVSGKVVSIDFSIEKKNLLISISSEINDPSVLSIFQSENIKESDFQQSNLLKVYTSKLIVESHQGVIEISTGENQHVIFNIYLPIKS